MSKPRNASVEELREYVRAGRNVMLIGTPGYGKTEKAIQAFRAEGYNCLYLATPTIDPYTDVVGIPVPNEDKTAIKFLQREGMDDYDAIFFDEINRAQNPKILNAILELIRTKSINGRRLKNLKCVWAALNPPSTDSKYSLIELSNAMMDRFEAFFVFEPELDPDYYKALGYNENHVNHVCRWWSDLSDTQKTVITARRVEMILNNLRDGLPLKNIIPYPHTGFPISALEKMIQTSHERMTIDYIYENMDQVIQDIKNDTTVGIAAISTISSSNIQVMTFFKKYMPVYFACNKDTRRLLWGPRSSFSGRLDYYLSNEEQRERIKEIISEEDFNKFYEDYKSMYTG